jgi:unsaturated rhamnogalacturonyl hydrolase
MSRVNFSRIKIEKIFRNSALIVLAGMCWRAYLPAAWPQQLPWSQRTANTAIARWPDGRPGAANPSQRYQLAMLLNGMDAVWYNTADGTYYRFVKQSIDQLLTSDGSISSGNPATKSHDSIALGRQLLLLYQVTQEEKFYKAATQLRREFLAPPSSASGDLLRKQSSPESTRLDEFATAEPFYAEYASIFREPRDFTEITRRFSLIAPVWVASGKQSSADKKDGPSPAYSSIAMGWYMMALVDTLPYYPKDISGRATLLAILNRTATAVARYQDQKTGLWYPVLNKPGEKKNGFESSAACMFVYALQKGVRLGYLPAGYSDNAARAWQGILSRFIQVDANGSMTIAAAGDESKTGKEMRSDTATDSNLASSVKEKGSGAVGPFLLASTEMELAPGARLAHGQVVMLDAWFNSQQRENAAGQKEYFHYKWSDYSNSGFSIFGHIFKSHGAELETLESAPTIDNLKGAQYYIIASPDIPIKNPAPHYANSEDATQIAQWVKQGGVLILMENDPPNADIEHLDLIADKFGIHFNQVLSHHVIGDDFPAGQIQVSGNGPLFHEPHTLYMKDTCTLSLKGQAIPLLEDKGDIMMATVKYGKGTVFAVVDPWLYNEYTDGRKRPPAEDNYAGGKELALWLLKQSRH